MGLRIKLQASGDGNAARRFGACLAVVAAAAFFSLWSPPAHARSAYSDSELRQVESPEEAKVRELRSQEVNELRITLGRRAAANRRADLYFRLAEIYLEAYQAEFLLEGRVHEKRLSSGREDKYIDRAHSKEYLKLGIKACKEILGFHIPFSRLDQVYYFLGFNASELGERKEGLKYFDYLTRAFPQSPFAGEAYRELGDAAYETSEYRRAQGYYEKAASISTGDTVPRILHRLAWCYYRTKQFDRAVATMKQAIAVAGKSGEKFLTLKEEGLRDIAMFMTESGKVEEAIEYFQNDQGDKTYYPKALEKLGKEYERNLEPAKATQVYESLLKTQPDSEAAFRVRVKLVDLDLRRGRFHEALNRIKSADIPQKGEPETLAAAANLKAMVRRTATEHHELFRKKANRADLEIAEAFYLSYIDYFLSKDDPRDETPEIQMYLAEVKRDLGKANEASKLYRSVVDSKDKRYAKEAGALWMASLAEAIKKSARPAVRATAPSELENEFVDAADRLQDALGETPDGREAALKSAQVLAGYKDTQKDAKKRIQKIISRWPKTSQAVTAARLWIQILQDEKDEDDLKDALKDIRENSDLMSADAEHGGKIKAMLGDYDTKGKISEIAKEEKDKDFKEAGQGYETFANESKEKEIAEKAYASAVQSFVKSEDHESVDRVISEWLKRFPRSPKAMESIRSTATRYLIVGSFDASTKLFELLGRSQGDADSLETGALIQLASGNAIGARKDREDFIKIYPRSPRRFAVALELADNYAEDAQDSLAAKSYEYCMSEGGELRDECGVRLADLYMKAQDVAKAKALYARIAGESGKERHKKARNSRKSAAPSGEASVYVGYARYRLAEIMERDVHFDILQLPENRLRKSLDQRISFLAQLTQAYSGAAQIGGPWGVAAIHRIALWGYRFADDIDHIQPPAGADASAVTEFRKTLGGISAPLRAKSVSTWEEGYSKACASGILSPALPEIEDYLADARQPLPGRAQGPHGKFELSGLPMDGGSDGRIDALARVRERLLKNFQDARAWVDYGNLLWGMDKPVFARVAYERADSLDPRNTEAYNNRAINLLRGDGEDDWVAAAHAQVFLEEALKGDPFFLQAKVNLGLLLNYYRVYPKSKTLWEQAAAKVPADSSKEFSKDLARTIYEGLAIAKQGLASLQAADADFKKAQNYGGSDSRFAIAYNEAARLSVDPDKGPKHCLSRLDDIDASMVAGFEKQSIDHLRRACKAWNHEE